MINFLIKIGLIKLPSFEINIDDSYCNISISQLLNTELFKTDIDWRKL